MKKDLSTCVDVKEVAVVRLGSGGPARQSSPAAPSPKSALEMGQTRLSVASDRLTH